MNIILIVDCYKIHNSLDNDNLPFAGSFVVSRGLMAQQTTTVKTAKSAAVFSECRHDFAKNRLSSLFLLIPFFCFTDNAPTPMGTLLFFNLIRKTKMCYGMLV